MRALISIHQVHNLTFFIVVMYLGTEDTSVTPSSTQSDIFVVVVYLGNEDTSGTPSATQADILYSNHVPWGSG